MLRYIGIFLGVLVQGYAASILIPTSLTQENQVVTGQTIHGMIPIQNNGEEKVTVRVTLADYLFNAKGESSFPSKGTCPRSNSSWLKTTKMYFEVAPHATYSFPYTIEVPSDASLEGTYWSIFLIEPVEEKNSPSDKEKSLGIQTIIRYGVQVITHIGKGSYNLKVLDKKIVQEGDKKTFTISVENPGTLMQAPVMSVELVDKEGKKVGRFEAAKQRILPSCSVSYQVDISTIPSGNYTAMVILDHGESAFFGAQYQVEM